MITQKGYSNMVHVPCWAHLLNKVGEVLFDNKLLPELAEYLRLTKLIFSRSPYWRTQWVKHQQEALEVNEKRKELNKTLPKEKQVVVSELPPVKSMLRGNDTRWDSQYDEVLYHKEYFKLVLSFYEKVL